MWGRIASQLSPTIATKYGIGYISNLGFYMICKGLEEIDSVRYYGNESYFGKIVFAGIAGSISGIVPGMIVSMVWPVAIPFELFGLVKSL